MKNYLPTELGVALKEQHDIREDILFSPPTEHEMYPGSNGYCSEYYTWGDRNTNNDRPDLRLVCFMERPYEWRTDAQVPHHGQQWTAPPYHRPYDFDYRIAPTAKTLRREDEDIAHMWLGGHVCKNNTISYSIYNSNLMDGRRHNGAKIRLAKYFQQESWTIFKRSEDFKHYLPITITNVTA